MMGLGLRRLRTFVVNQLGGQAVVLLYHRVADLVPDPPLLCVSPAHFEEHLQHIRRHYQPIALGETEKALKTGKLPRKAVVITFDDGYADNLWYAKPLLEKYDCPATVFVVSGYIGKNRELISDELERILLEAPRLPERLCLTIAGQTLTWELGDTEAQFIAWDVLREDYPTPRHRCYRELHGLLRAMDQNGREQVLAALRDWSGDLSEARPRRRVMNADEIRELAKGNLIDVGAHTVNHLLLAAQRVEVQKREIVSDKEYLEEIVGQSVTAFAYPYGGPPAVNSQTVQLVRDAGFHLACDNVPGSVNIKTNPLLLPRYMVFNWTGDEFARHLKSFFGG